MTQVASSVPERSAQRERPSRTPDAGGLSVAPGLAPYQPEQVLALQRVAGNTAVQQLLARRPSSATQATTGLALQRCGTGCGCRTCTDDLDEEERRLRRRDTPVVLLQRCGKGCGCRGCDGEPGEERLRLGSRAAARMLQRSPAYRPDPSWSTKGPDQGEYACVPLPEWLAEARWAVWSRIFPDEAADRSSCPEVGDVWRSYFGASGSPRYRWSEATTPNSCVLRSLKNDDDHRSFEDPIIDRVRSSMRSLVPRLRGQSSVVIPLAEAGVSGTLLTPALNLNHNTRAGGSLFGGVGESEYGPDTRKVDGTVELIKQVDPDNRLWISVLPRFELHWHITDGVDFCPGNTGERAAWIVQNAVTVVSQLEASGMARDIYVEADYTRVRHDTLQGPFPNPDFQE